MKVRDLMSRDITRLPPTATVREAIALMESRRISSVIVEREGEDEPFGIVTRRDIVYRVAARGLDPAHVQLAGIMSLALITVDPALDSGYASRLMRRFNIRHLPVLRDTELVGIVSYHDVLRVFTLLVSVPFFRELGVEDLIALLQIAAVRACPPGTVLIQEGRMDRDLFLLDEGEMEVSTCRAGRIARIQPGEFFGEVELFGGQRSATVRAVSTSRVLVFDGRRFLELVGRRERLGAVVYGNMARILSERLKRANRFLFLRGIWAHRLLVLRVAVIAAAIFASLVLGTAAVSESPAFCKSCHYMRPYQASWSASPHRDVTCTKCHKSYGLGGAVRGKITGVAMLVRYATKTYGPKPEAKVDDTSCLSSGCHSTATRAWIFRSEGGDTTRSHEVWFDHARHLRPLSEVGTLRCTSCHGHREQEEHFSVSASTCFLCHFSSEVSSAGMCRACHQVGRDSGSGKRLRVDHSRLARGADCLACHRNVASGSVRVEESRCTACHLQPDSLPSVEMHRVHVLAADVDCLDCHSTITHPGPEDRILAGRCDACHVGEHSAQERLYLGEGGVGVTGRPALMFYMHVECTACHQAGSGAMDSTHAGAAPGVTGQVCLDCHDVSAADQARMWRTTIERSLERVRSALARFEAAAGPATPTSHPEAFRLYQEARRNYETVREDPSAAIHNFRYAQDLLEASEERLGTALSLVGAGDGDR